MNPSKAKPKAMPQRKSTVTVIVAPDPIPPTVPDPTQTLVTPATPPDYPPAVARWIDLLARLIAQHHLNQMRAAAANRPKPPRKPRRKASPDHPVEPDRG
jgi:hypothetical protein